MQWISSIFWKCWKLCYSISKKCWKFIASKMIEIKSQHMTWGGGNSYSNPHCSNLKSMKVDWYSTLHRSCNNPFTVNGWVIRGCQSKGIHVQPVSTIWITNRHLIEVGPKPIPYIHVIRLKLNWHVFSCARNSFLYSFRTIKDISISGTIQDIRDDTSTTQFQNLSWL